MTDYVVYTKLPHYGELGHMGRKLDGTPIEGHYGGVMFCPRCDSPLSVAQEQIEHIGSPCSVAHTSTHYRDILEGKPKRRCGAHFVTQDPEEKIADYQFPQGTAEWVTGSGDHTLYRRPIRWESDA